MVKQHGSGFFLYKLSIALGLFVFVFLSFFARPLFVYAEEPNASSPTQAAAEVGAAAAAAACSSSSGALGSFICESFAQLREFFGTVGREILSPQMKVVYLSTVLDVFQFVLDTAAYKAAVYLSSGGTGQSALYETQDTETSWQSFGLDVAGEAIGALSENLATADLHFNLCSPSSPALRLGFQLGIKGVFQPPKPSCDWRDITENWNNFLERSWQEINPNDFVLKQVSQGLRPGQNALSAGVKLNVDVHWKALEKKQRQFQEMLQKDGFKDVVDVVTGNVKTPSSVLQTQFNEELKAAKEAKREANFKVAVDYPELGFALLKRTLSVFFNTLLSEMFTRVYTGLFEPNPIDNSDIFNSQLVSTMSREEAEKRYASFVSATPISVTNYSAMAEFTVCPSNVAIRQLNNCVLDANFANAISRGEAGSAFTVSEALSEGLLHGDWALYPPDDLTRNQDPFCYTYGYCYGNLVKLRKARIIPIGWELAASSAYNNQSNPITLREAVEGFHECNTDGKLDASHPWCHLIDPNWVLTYPETQCQAYANGEILTSQLASGRGGVCVDTPSCISEDGNGNCTGGFGYCTREKNIWRFDGDECPEAYASCLTFKDTTSGTQSSWLLNTVNFEGCSQSNAGCLWYKTQKTLDNKNTSDETDDSYEWLATDEEYLVVKEDESQDAYLDRIYFTHNVKSCDETAAGCTALYAVDQDLSLNLVRNPSFEDDEDGDGLPDFWFIQGSDTSIFDDSGDYSFDGQNSFRITKLSSPIQSSIVLQQGLSYVASFYAKDEGGEKEQTRLQMKFRTSDGSLFDLTNYSTTCTPWTSTSLLLSATQVDSEEFERFFCTFTTPFLANKQADIFLDLSFSKYPETFYIDAIQIEPGSVVSNFHEGYSLTSPSSTYLRLAPSWLGCEGKNTDPAACADYANICPATQAGCKLYTPEDGDPAVPAVTSSLDECPSECAGYTAYKQEATLYEEASFPEYFIANIAQSCTSEYVGCDEFTNLSTEAIEAYNDIRACVSPQMNAGQAYFTWEGSDNSGYQLYSWQLLPSNKQTTTGGTPPCTHWKVDSLSSLICEDTSAQIDDEDCNEHDDIFINPDCREFYDETGEIHYRLYSQTISVSDECVSYRKTISSQTNCVYSKGFWTGSECVYYVEPNESGSCPTSEIGCRSYTGGSGRNATTIFTEIFEEGTFETFSTQGTVEELTISNESIATDGHSLRVVADAQAGISSLHVYYDENDLTNACSSENGCEATDTASTQGTCTVLQGKTSCGTLVDWLVPGKTYLLEFWAKGSGPIKVSFLDKAGKGSEHVFSASVNLGGGWERYSLGPIDTSQAEFASFDAQTVLAFLALQNDTTFYLDNIELIEAEENLTLIKDSWITPATCDQTPAGTSSPQYYLGCEAYTTIDDESKTFYQFETLCEEENVGCQAFYQTENNTELFGTIYQARCMESGVVNVLTDCQVDGEVVCQISPGFDYCFFDSSKLHPEELPSSVALGPEARVIKADHLVYVIEDSQTTCLSSDQGCREFGTPNFSQDRQQVEDFESIYFIDLPDTYKNDIQCTSDGLFCEEWSTTQNGNYYFKDPFDQQCEYKTSVTLSGGGTYSGWFRKGTTEFCYWSGVCSSDSTTVCTSDADCLSQDLGTCEFVQGTYLKGGTYSSIWRNGDAAYDGWVGVCESQYDLCTEFMDPLDTGEGEDPDGKAYYFLNNESINNDKSSTSPCEGQISLEQGCALFQDRLIPDLLYSAAPSYLFSQHADLLSPGDDPQSLQPPIDCSTQTGGDYIVRGLTIENCLSGKCPSQSGGTMVDLCARRCEYTVTSGGSLKEAGAIEADDQTYYIGACLVDTDCPVLEDTLRNDLTGTCVEVTDAYRFENDTNSVIQVDRDRACAQWLACSSWYSAWDERDGHYRNICDQIDLCTQYSRSGDSTFCSNWTEQTPLTLTTDIYTGRNTSWYGLEYSGFSIPNQLPIEFYGQININPSLYCVDNVSHEPQKDSKGELKECAIDSDCKNSSQICEIAEPDYRLAYMAGYCDENRGEDCLVGFCSISGKTCTNDNACNTASLETCITGYCIASPSTETYCTADNDCTTSPYTTCQGGVCVEIKKDSSGKQMGCFNTSDCTSGGTCIPAALAKTGACYNENCLLDVNGAPFEIEVSETQQCRGYPEISSPFSVDIVEEWIDPDALNNPKESINTYDATPYTFKYGFQGVSTCAPYLASDGSIQFTDDCMCNYDRISYGQGASFRYYPVDISFESIPNALCIGGKNPGKACGVDDCEGSLCGADLCDGGDCSPVTKKDTFLGWEGYCVERDTSIQINGETDTKNRACLTWLPVDQLVGSTDLYAKYTEAGYGEKDTYYCADVDVTYTLKTSTDFACAESFDYDEVDSSKNYVLNCQNDTAVGSSWWNHEACWMTAFCPRGYFGVITGCKDYAPKKDDGDPMCGGADDDNSDSDCPFFCVPELSFHEDSGEPCEAPTGLSSKAITSSNSIADNESDQIDGSYINFTMYAAPADTWTSLKTRYADCAVKGLLESDVESFLQEKLSDQSIYVYEGDEDDSHLYRDLVIPIYPEVACTSLIKVATKDNKTEYNIAWTDRVWDDGSAQSRYTIQSDTEGLNYSTLTSIYPFGAVKDLNEFKAESFYQIDPVPITPAMCDSNDDSYLDLAKIPETISTNVKCPSEYSMPPNEQTGDYARPYQAIELGSGYSSSYGGTTYYFIGPEGTEPSDQMIQRAVDRLKQIFAKSISGSYVWNPGNAGNIVKENNPSDAWNALDNSSKSTVLGKYENKTLSEEWTTWDITATGDGKVVPTPPVVKSVGMCYSNLCQEGEEDAFTVNGVDSGIISGTEGQQHVTVKFFAYADSDQMPLRNIVVDWGDGKRSTEGGGLPWPTNSQTGSSSGNNFYKNHRGLIPKSGNKTLTYCDGADEDGNLEWGFTNSACDASYFNFEHDYLCSESILNTLGLCEFTEDGRLKNSPCLGGGKELPFAKNMCVFQPRVHLKDNWGWCTGNCTSALSDDNTDNCYAGKIYDECNTSKCPSEGIDKSCPDYWGGTTNPWINFTGYIVVEPQN